MKNINDMTTMEKCSDCGSEEKKYISYKCKPRKQATIFSGGFSGIETGRLPYEVGIMMKRINREITNEIEKINEIVEKARIRGCKCQNLKGLALISHLCQKHKINEKYRELINNDLLISYEIARSHTYPNKQVAKEKIEEFKEYPCESIQAYYQKLINLPHWIIADTDVRNLLTKEEIKEFNSTWMAREWGMV